jgi:hypothetical protein
VDGKLHDLPYGVPTYIWHGIASQLPDSLESKIDSKTKGIQQVPGQAQWEAIASRIEHQPGVFEEALASKLAHYQAPVSRQLMHRILSQSHTAAPLYWKRAITSIAAVFLLFIGFSLIPSQLRSPYTGVANTSPSLMDSPSNQKGETAMAHTDFADNQSKENRNKPLAPTLYAEGAQSPVYPNPAYAAISQTMANTLHQAVASPPVYPTHTYAGHSGVNPARFNGSSHGPILDSIGVATMKKPIVKDLEPIVEPTIEILDYHIAEYKLVKLVAQEPPVQVGIKMSTGFFGVHSSAPADDPIYDRSFASFQNDIYQPGQYVTIGARISYAIHSAIDLVTGLDISSTQQNQSFDLYAFDNYDNYESITSDGAVITKTFNPDNNQLRQKKSMDEETREVLAELNLMPDSVMVGETYAITDRYLLADIPLGIELDVYQFYKGSLGIAVGGKYRIVAGANTYHITADRGTMVEVSPALAPTFYRNSVVATAGIWYKKHVGKHMELHVGPEININLSQLNQSHSWVSMRPVQLGLNVSLRQRLG